MLTSELSLLVALLCFVFTGILRPFRRLVQRLWDSPQGVNLPEVAEQVTTAADEKCDTLKPPSHPQVRIDRPNRIEERPADDVKRRANRCLRRAFSEPP